MTLSEKQRLFAKFLGEFLVWIYAQGYEVVGGDWHREKSQAVINASTGTGILHTLHLLSLACDLSLFIQGIYQKESETYRPLGDKWKSFHPLCRWGGDFTTIKDGGHFSMEHEGVR